MNAGETGFVNVREMKTQLAHSMGIAQENIDIKATTNERVDVLGAGLAIAAHAVVLIEKVRG